MKNRITSMLIGGFIGVLVTSLVFVNMITDQTNNASRELSEKRRLY